MEFTIDCFYCSPTNTLFRAALPLDADVVAWRRAWKAAAGQVSSLECSGCGGQFAFEDDGVAADEGGLVVRRNISSPKITGLNTSSGPRTGGTALFLAGDALDIGSLSVLVGGKPVTLIDQRTQTSARVLTPPATYELLYSTSADRFTTTPVLGNLQAWEAVISPSGSTGTVWLISGSTHWIYFDYVAPEDGDLVGIGLTGSTSGGIVTVSAVDYPTFLPGETAFGLTSVAQGTVRTAGPLLIDSPTAAFVVNELVKGGTSGALVKLNSDQAYSGTVDVVVENEHGRRKVGGALTGAYTYA